ncbi:MAG: lipoprotein, partial [Pseudomonadota bacterium]
MPRRPARPPAVTSRRILLGAALAAWPLLGRAAPPGWAVEPPRDDAQWLWGVGSGPGLDEARRAALRQVAAHLRSTIS